MSLSCYLKQIRNNDLTTEIRYVGDAEFELLKFLTMNPKIQETVWEWGTA